LNKLTLGFAMCGSFCTFETALAVMQKFAGYGVDILPIMSFNAARIDTRFGRAAEIKKRIRDITGRRVIETIDGAEPLGPKKMCDIMLVAPCTGNTLAKLAAGVTDTPVTMAVKSHLRNRRPVVLAIATNDALSASAKNIGELLNRKNYYFVPMSQDAPDAKPTSVIADFSLVKKTLDLALKDIQIQPIIK